MLTVATQMKSGKKPWPHNWKPKFLATNLKISVKNGQTSVFYSKKYKKYEAKVVRVDICVIKRASELCNTTFMLLVVLVFVSLPNATDDRSLLQLPAQASPSFNSQSCYLHSSSRCWWSL